MGKQMDPRWIEANLGKMETSADPAVRRTSRLIDENPDIVRPKANVLDPSGINRWNRIRVGN
jgi:hypothetical protein